MRKTESEREMLRQVEGNIIFFDKSASLYLCSGRITTQFGCTYLGSLRQLQESQTFFCYSSWQMEVASLRKYNDIVCQFRSIHIYQDKLILLLFFYYDKFYSFNRQKELDDPPNIHHSGYKMVNIFLNLLQLFQVFPVLIPVFSFLFQK